MIFAAVVVGLGLLALDLISSQAFDVLFALAMGSSVFIMLSRIGFPRSKARIAAIAVPVFALGTQILVPSVQLTPYLAVVLVNTFVAYVFGRGLGSDRTPLIVQLIRITNSGPEGTQEFRRYVYGQGWVWMVFGLMTALCGLAAMLIAPLRPTLDPAISALLIVQVIWFVLGHYWARLRHKRPETWLGTLRVMARPVIWTELEI